MWSGIVLNAANIFRGKSSAQIATKCSIIGVLLPSKVVSSNDVSNALGLHKNYSRHKESCRWCSPKTFAALGSIRAAKKRKRHVEIEQEAASRIS